MATDNLCRAAERACARVTQLDRLIKSTEFKELPVDARTQRAAIYNGLKHMGTRLDQMERALRELDRQTGAA